MLTHVTDENWEIMLTVFDATQSRRGEPGHDDRKFLEAIFYFAVHNVTWRALPVEFGNWNNVWKRFWRLSGSGVFEAFFPVAGRAKFDSASGAILRQHGRPGSRFGGRRKRGQQNQALWTIARRVFDQNPSQDRPQGRSTRFPPDRWREEPHNSTRNFV